MQTIGPQLMFDQFGPICAQVVVGRCPPGMLLANVFANFAARSEAELKVFPWSSAIFQGRAGLHDIARHGGRTRHQVGRTCRRHSPDETLPFVDGVFESAAIWGSLAGQLRGSSTEASGPKPDGGVGQHSAGIGPTKLGVGECRCRLYELMRRS